MQSPSSGDWSSSPVAPDQTTMSGSACSSTPISSEPNGANDNPGDNDDHDSDAQLDLATEHVTTRQVNTFLLHEPPYESPENRITSPSSPTSTDRPSSPASDTVNDLCIEVPVSLPSVPGPASGLPHRLSFSLTPVNEESAGTAIIAVRHAQFLRQTSARSVMSVISDEALIRHDSTLLMQPERMESPWTGAPSGYVNSYGEFVQASKDHCQVHVARRLFAEDFSGLTKPPKDTTELPDALEPREPEILKLRQQVEWLPRQNSEFASKNAKLTARNSELEGLAQQSVSKIVNLNEQLRVQNVRVADMETQLNELGRFCDKLKEMIEAQRDRSKDLERQLDDALNHNDELEAHIQQSRAYTQTHHRFTHASTLPPNSHDSSPKHRPQLSPEVMLKFKTMMDERKAAREEWYRGEMEAKRLREETWKAVGAMINIPETGMNLVAV